MLLRLQCILLPAALWSAVIAMAAEKPVAPHSPDLCTPRQNARFTLRDPAGLRQAIAAWGARSAQYPAAALTARLEKLLRQPETAAWGQAMEELLRDALIRRNPLVDFDRLLCVKRFTYDSNHYYTEYINSHWMPGGGLCIVNLNDGSVQRLAAELEGGVFERFDLSFDARKVVFAWKKGPRDGYRLYEVGVDGSGLRQLTFPPPDEERLVERYSIDKLYHHGTDDMQPCYLADGGIVFISTRCQYGILCDGADNLTTTTLYRIDADGANLRRLSNSSVSEASPVALPDGRLLYTRWEYVDKGAVSVKCLWAMRPDGSSSSEVFGNDIALPPTLIYGRPIPAAPDLFVALGAPHYPQNGFGTVIRIDARRDIRTREPMTYMTPDVDVQDEGGFAFRDADGKWQNDRNGRLGPLYKDPYPLAANLFLTARKPTGPMWSDPTAYSLHALDEAGNSVELYRDAAISTFLPMPLRPRPRPPVLSSPVDRELAARGLALCVVRDVYAGMENVRRGEIKYLRVLEQIPRPWAARRGWQGDVYDQQHACVSKDTHLALKVQHGVVPVEDDGSASFLVPAERNIFLQALDAQYMAVQTERTYVNYMPGETRSCIGCHVRPNEAAPAAANAGQPKSMRRMPSLPGPQPGETAGRRLLDYTLDVQPVWDRHCVRCHGGEKTEGDFDLRGTSTELFNISYENLVPERRKPQRRDRGLLGPVIGENHPKTGNVDYLPARSLGSHASVLAALLSKGHVRLTDPAQAARVEKLQPSHKDVSLTPEELLKVTNWIDTNAQYYGSYWGKRNVRYQNDADFRPRVTFDQAVSTMAP